MPDRIGFDRGFHLRGTPLWFDAERRREHCVLTSITHRLPPLHRRVVAPEALAAALERGGYRGSVLPVSWDRWVGFGGQQLRFVDLGGVVGTSAVLVTHGTERVLMTGLLPRNDIEWPHADHLVAQLPALMHRGGSLEQVADSIERFQYQARADGCSTAVLVESIDVGQACVDVLAERGLAVRATGLLGRLVEGATGGRRAPAVALAGSRVKADRYVWVDTGLFRGSRALVGPSVSATFRLRWYCDLSGIRELILATGARALSVAHVPVEAREALQVSLGSSVVLKFLLSARQLPLGAAS